MKTTAIKPVFKTTDPLRVIYVSTVGPYNGGGIDKAWDKVCKFAAKKGLLSKDTRYIGISYDDPNITDPDKLRYDACVTVQNEIEPEGEVGVKTIPGGKCAVFLHTGSYVEFESTYNFIFGEWLPESGMELRDANCFELYLNSPEDTNPADLKTEIWLPVQ